jgi:biopolymer transport protein ExbD
MAGGSSRADEGKKKARIEIIPLIDVIFFLLATFVLFTLSLNKIQSVPVQLPQASDHPGPPDEDMITIQVSDRGTFYWRLGTSVPELINEADIAPRLEHYKTTTRVPKVLVTGDDKAKFGAAVKVLDQVRLAEIQQVSIETRWRPTGK